MRSLKIIMKKIFISVFLFFLLSQGIHSQVVNSVLSEGNWFKFSVDTTGVFKIDKSFLQDIGIEMINQFKKLLLYLRKI